MIQAEDLSKQFGDFWAVDGVNLEVGEGQVLVLLGQNGAGKTTTLRMLTSVLHPTRGSAKVMGNDVVAQADAVRKSVGVLTEQHGLYLRMSGIEYLDFFGNLYDLEVKERLERSRFLLDYFGLSQVAHQNIGKYSKGMRQKLALARALIHKPPVLLLDEPTSAMDPESARLVRDYIADLRSRNCAIMICTHNLSEAESLADVIAIIYRGRILIQGSLSDLRRKLLGPAEYVVTIAGKGSDNLDGLPDGVTLINRTANYLYFRVNEPQSSNPVLIRELISRRLQVVAVQEVKQSLEQVYLKTMEVAQREYPAS